MAEHFGYDIDRRYLPILLPFLVRPSKDGVTLTDEALSSQPSASFRS